MKNIRLLILILSFPAIAFSQGYTVQSIQKINNQVGGLTGSPLDNDDNFGAGAEVIGDVDHDGIDDIAVGSYYDDDNGTNLGAIYILMLNADGTVKAQQKISSLNGNGPPKVNGQFHFGTSIAALGDLNGDGNVDIAVGMTGGDDAGTVLEYKGAVWILFLDDDGTVLEHQKISNNEGGGPGDLNIRDNFGAKVKSIGDINKDGLPDLAITVRNWTNTNEGVVYIANLDYDGTAKHIQKITQNIGGFGGSLDTNDYFGMGVTNIGDLNGDGIEDIAVGAPGDDDGGSNRGGVWICFMNTDGTVASEQKISNTTGAFLGTLANGDNFGSSIVAVGDINFDGINDIMVGAHLDDDGGTNEGAMWFLYLNVDGTVKGYDKVSTTDVMLSPEVNSNEQFLYDVSFFGDRNNDGKIDLLIGAYDASDGTISSGEVYVVHLEGLATYPNKSYHGTTPFINSVAKHSALAGEPLASELAGWDTYGRSIAAIGDLDGDGINDVVIGAHNDDDGGTNRGAVYVQFLNADGSIKSYQKISDTQGGFTGVLDNSDYFGVAVSSLGDLDNDGVTDIAVGAHQDDDGGTGRGAVWILFLNTNGTVKSYQKISDTAGNFSGTLADIDVFGVSLSSPGDMDGDGIRDLIVGSTGNDDGYTDAGALWILFLDTNGTVKSEQKISATVGNFNDTLSVSSAFGFSITGLGDLDNDGNIDIALGALYDDDKGVNAGAVYVLFLTDSGTVKSSKKITAGNNGFDALQVADDRFGSGVEGGFDIDMDGVNDLFVGGYTSDHTGTDRGNIWMLLMNSDGTVKSHKIINATSKKLTTLIDNSDYIGLAMSIVEYDTQNNTAKFAFGAHADDDGGTDVGAVYVLTIDLMSTYDPSPLSSAIHNSVNDVTKNWSYGESYDENGKIIGISKQYVDELGRNTQSLTYNLDKNRVLAAQTVYDTYGRPVLNTMPAPIGVNMVYKDNFITDVNGNPYNHLNFDTVTTLNNPDSVGYSLPNTLGDYYSDSGEDDYLATSAFPYSRMEYMADPTGRMKRSAAPGENFKMGSGHESRVFYMFTGGELDRAFGIDSSFYCQTDTADRLESKALANTEIIADKTISVDAEGNIAITFKSDGLTIASCVSGKTPSPSVPVQSALSTMLYVGTQSVDIHLPKAKSGSLVLPLPQYEYGGEQTVPSYEISYTIIDLETNEEIPYSTSEGSSETYSFDVESNRYLVFTNTSKDHFLRISFSYTPNMLAYFETNSITPPDAKVQYLLDYSHFTANYYDLAGRLRKNVSPKGFDYSVNGKHTEFSKYDYDQFGQLIAKETPDEGLMEYLYSNEGAVRFSQNAQQRTDNKFSYVRYDEYNRSIESGEYDESTGVFEFAGYYDAALIGTDVKNQLNNVDYDFNDSYCSNQNYIAYDVLASVDEIPSSYTYKSSYPQHNLKARVSKTWNDYNQTWYSYDYAGRPEYTVQQLLDVDFDADTTADVTIKTVDYTYTPLTSVLLTEEFQKNHATEKLTHAYTYNNNQQLTQVLAKDHNNSIIGEAAFEYYINGQLKRKELGGDMQGIDYVYTLHGQLKSINHPSLYDAYDPGKDGKSGSDNANFKADIFGMALDYYQNDYTRTGTNILSSVTSSANGYNNGLIKANRWRIKEENVLTKSASYDTLYTESAIDKELMYNYNYDEFYRFETATFGVFDNDAVSSAFTDRDDFKVFGASASNGIAYDIIGNIKNLYRHGYQETSGPGLMMDSLSYVYNEGTSQLGTITDNSTSTYATDFETTTGTDFTYNNLGQMTASESDDVSAVTYYPNGQVKKVTFGNSNTAEYFYNERNIKIKSKFTDVAAGSIKYNWYITDASGALKSVHERTDASSVSLTNQAVYGGGRLGMYDVISGMLNYELTDHLGNVRATFKDTSSTATTAIEITSWADYYPFGEVLPGRNSNPTGMFGYQGQERVSNSTNEVAGSRWYNFNLRMYNPSLGRFNTIDPYSQFNSPYLAMANNPISFVDPDGGKALLSQMQLGALVRGLELRRMRGEYYGRPLEYMRLWAATTGNDKMNLGGKMVSADELYAFSMSFGVSTATYLGGRAMRGGGYMRAGFSNISTGNGSSAGAYANIKSSMTGGGGGGSGWDAMIGIFGLETMTNTAGYGMTPEPSGGFNSLEYFASGEMQWAKLNQWADDNQKERIKNGWKPMEYDREQQKKDREDRKKTNKQNKTEDNKGKNDEVAPENNEIPDNVYASNGKVVPNAPQNYINQKGTYRITYLDLNAGWVDTRELDVAFESGDGAGSSLFYSTSVEDPKADLAVNRGWYLEPKGEAMLNEALTGDDYKAPDPRPDRVYFRYTEMTPYGSRFVYGSFERPTNIQSWDSGIGGLNYLGISRP